MAVIRSLTDNLNAVVAALMKADVDLTKIRSEDDIAATVAARLKDLSCRQSNAPAGVSDGGGEENPEALPRD